MSFSGIASSMMSAASTFMKLPEQIAKQQIKIQKSDDHKKNAMQRTQAKQAQKKAVQPKTTAAAPASPKAKPAMQRMSERRKGKLNGVNWKKKHGNG